MSTPAHPVCPLTSSSMVAAVSASPSRLRQGKALSTVSTAQSGKKAWTSALAPNTPLPAPAPNTHSGC